MNSQKQTVKKLDANKHAAKTATQNFDCLQVECNETL